MLCGLCAPVCARAAAAVTAELEGISDAALRTLLKSVAACFDPARPAPANPAILRQRAEADRAAMTEALASAGYFAARVTVLTHDGTPPRVTFTASPGRLHHYGRLTVRRDGASDLKLPTPLELGLTAGAPALSRPVLAARARLETWLTDHGHPIGSTVDQRVQVSLARGTMDVAFVVTPGPAVRFGPVTFSGLTTVDEAALRGEIPWKTNAPYDPAKLLEFQRLLLSRNLFSTAQVRLGALPGHAPRDAPVAVPITVTVKERNHRTVRAGLNYRTDSGAGGQVQWSHRNIGGTGDRFDTEIVASELTQNASAKYIRPRFVRSDQTLIADVRVAHDTPIAFDSDNFITSVKVERIISSRTHVDAGLSLKVADVDQNGVNNRFGLVQLPFSATHDTSDGLLDPTRGQRLALSVVPSLDPFEGQTNLLVTTLRHRSYTRLGSDERRVLATRLVLGVITAKDRATIPADERFYAGGGGSVRGYPFKSIGVGTGTTVLGGKTLIEGSLEFRQKLPASFGLVAFVDAGSVQDANFGISNAFLVGVGAGLRYFSGVGPVRIDVAVPLDRRPDIDSQVQFYASLGQAF